jgi:hypothetical protein
MKIILYDPTKLKVLNEAILDKPPHVIHWNGLTFARFGISDDKAFYEQAEEVQL